MDIATPGRGTLNKKQMITVLQWLVTIGASYLMLFNKGEVVGDTWSFGLIALFLIATLVLYRLPDELFHHRYFDVTFLIVDTAFISAAIYQNRGGPWDLFLLYFFVLFLAAAGGGQMRVVLGFIVICLVYLGFLLREGKGIAELGSDFFIRIAFLFGISILYGYLSENATKEKVRAESAEQKERVKMDLVSALAHDIKNPLGVIMNYAEILKDQLAGRTEDRGKIDILDRVQDNAQRIVTLVTGFLDASKAEAGKLEIARGPVSVNHLLDVVARHQESDVAKKKLILRMDLDNNLPELLGDNSQLERVFWNLLGNAIKFTPAGGKITVTSRRDDGHICVSFRDTGIGIPPNELPLLFSQFKRLKGSAKIEGTGLGLFIVKTIVEAHKGTVQVESLDGQGSTFTVRVPIRA
ncbi:MAG TPA: HAMP domain-containing sensor histidine kinase [Candidatus Binatia bacterium]